VKYYHLTIGARGQAKWAKVASTYDVTHKKKHIPQAKNLFECRPEDLPRLLRLLPGL